MRISIYQVKISQDTLNLSFRDLQTILTKNDGNIPAESYDQVYTSEVGAKTLEDVFAIFNLHHPLEYRGRSLSVSDVVEVIDGSVNPGFYYCDTFGFKEVEFDKSQCTEGDGR